MESLPSRGAWIEIPSTVQPLTAQPSLPSRGAWIEIFQVAQRCLGCSVAPLTGSVD